MSKISVPKLSTKTMLVLAGIVVLAVSSYAYFHSVYSSPANVFERMISNSLSSPSVSKRITQDDEVQKLVQIINLQTSPQQLVHTNSILTQTNGGVETTKVTNESIGTLTADFVRYVDIKTNQKNEKNLPFDFSSIINIWGKSEANTPTSSGAELFNQNVLGVVPTANISQPVRGQLIGQIFEDGVYKYDKKTLKRKIENGRPVYVYEVSVQPVAYVTMLKSFAHALGLNQLEQVDPSRYKGSQPLSFIFEIDVWSGQLTKISYKDSSRSESYGAYGARTRVNIPKDSIPVNELQTRLQQIR